MKTDSLSSKYARQKTEIEKVARTVLKIAENTHNIAVTQFLRETLDKLSQEEVYLAIFGLFKRGKSTLINALLGQTIVPTGVTPVTSIITRIRYSEKLKAKITFDDNTTKEVPIEDLSKYVTETGNPNNSKKVIIADVFVPAPILKDGLILIDTPGVGSTYISGTQVTFEFLDRADVAIFVLAVDPPIGQQEIEFIKNLATKSNKILFILNKIDYVDHFAVNESLNYSQRVIDEQLAVFGFSSKIYPVSAKTALDGRLYGDNRKIVQSGIEPFVEALHNLLLDKKERLVLRAAQNKINKIISDLMDYIQLQINSLTMSVDNFARIETVFEQYLTLVEQKKREIFYVLEGRARELVAVLDTDLCVFKKNHEEVLVRTVEGYVNDRLSSKETNSRKVVDDVDNYLRKVLIDTYSEFIRQEDLKLGFQFVRLVDETNEKMNLLLSDVKQMVSQLFGFQMVDVSFDVSLNFETKFYYHLDPVFMVGITFSVWEFAELLPKVLFKGVLKRKVSERVRAEFDKNSGRIRYDYFVVRIDQGILRLKGDIVQALEFSVETVKQGIFEAKLLRSQSDLEVRNQADNLKTMLNELQITAEMAKLVSLN